MSSYRRVGGRMGEDRLKRFVSELQESFLEGRWENFQQHFRFPVVIYSVIGVRLVRDAEELIHLMEQYCLAAPPDSFSAWLVL